MGCGSIGRQKFLYGGFRLVAAAAYRARGWKRLGSVSAGSGRLTGGRGQLIPAIQGAGLFARASMLLMYFLNISDPM